MSNVSDQEQNKQLTRYLAHALIVLAAVSGFLTVGITVAHCFSLGVFKTLVVPAGAAVRALPLPAARLGLWDYLPAEKRQISTDDEPKTRRAPSVRSHDGNLPGSTNASLLDGAGKLSVIKDTGGVFYIKSKSGVTSALTPTRTTDA